MLQARLDRISEPHVAPLNEWVFRLRARLGADAMVPWFDPADGGVAATILWLLEAPGPKASRERGGSGIVSCDNDDGTAANAWQSRVDAKVDRALVVHWNVIPYHLGSTAKIRPWEPSDVRDAGPLLAELFALLPEIRCVILGGAAARATWSDHRPEAYAGAVVECPHPSPTNWNTRPATGAAVVDAWRTAKRLATW
ncbi:uracil-DNA glycosylase [soil metagenome]